MLQLVTVQGQARRAGAWARGLRVIVVLRQHHDHFLLAVLVCCTIVNPSWQLSQGHLEEEHLAGYTNHLWKTTNICGFKDKRCKAMMGDECMHTVIVLAFNRKQTILALVVPSFYSRKIKFGNIILILRVVCCGIIHGKSLFIHVFFAVLSSRPLLK